MCVDSHRYMHRTWLRRLISAEELCRDRLLSCFECIYRSKRPFWTDMNLAV